MEWWNDLRMLCARFLVASEQMERSGPVAAAVRSAGYVTESEEEEEEEERSSADEGEEDAEEIYEDASAELPGYAQHAMNGYPVGFFKFSIAQGSPTPVVTQVEKADIKTNGNGNGIGPEPNVDDTPAEPLSRRPSRRQQEKAPEGRAPHVQTYTDGPDNDHHEEEHGHGQDQNERVVPTAVSEHGESRSIKRL